MSSPCPARGILEEVKSPNLQLQMDIFHTQRVDGNIAQRLADNMDVIGMPADCLTFSCMMATFHPTTHTGHIQVAQVPGRHEPSAEGELNYRFIFQEMARLGYTGWIGCEYVPAGQPYL